MSKKTKIIIGVIGIILASGLIVFSSYYKTTKETKQIPDEIYQQIEESANKQLEAVIEEEKKKLDKEYKEKLAKCTTANTTDNNNEITEEAFTKVKFYDLILNYYSNAEKNELLTEQMNTIGGVSNYVLKFNESSQDEFITDNEDKIKHSYSIEHKSNTRKDNKKEIVKYESIINITFQQKEKFDINKCNLFKEYIEQLLERELTSKELSVINIVANSDTSSLTSISELEKYLYEKDGIKIDDIIINATTNLDDVTGKYIASFIITN